MKSNGPTYASIRASVARAIQELPDGTPDERLRNFTGRAWDVFRSPDFRRLDRLSHAPGDRNQELGRQFARDVIAPLVKAVERILRDGPNVGDHPPGTHRAAARLLVSSLLAQARWVDMPDRFGALLDDCHSRQVSETVSVLLQAVRAGGASRPSRTGPPRSAVA